MANQIGNVLNAISDPAQNPAVQAENQTILGLHAALEATADASGLAGTVHGLTNTGETLGLGRIGGDNLLTDTAQAPGDIVNGASPVAVATTIVTDADHVFTAAGGMVTGAGYDIANPNLASDVVNGLAGAALGGVPNGGSESLVTVGAGTPGGSPILNTGILTAPDDATPVGVGVVNGPNIVNIHLLDGISGGHLITGTGGAPGGGSPLADAGLLTTPDTQSPLGAVVGNGPNIADAAVLGHSGLLQTVSSALQGINGMAGSGDHLVTGNAGAAGGLPLADAGILTNPDSQSPLGTEIGNAQNIANVSALTHGGALSFPDLGGAGTDALTGIVPSALDLGPLRGGTFSPVATEHALIDIHSDGSSLVQTHDHATSTVGVNDHALV